MGPSTLTEDQLDALREVSNIGMGHAATALSRLMDKTVHLHVPKVMVMDITGVPGVCGGAERMVAGIYLQIQGRAKGNILMIFPIENALEMLEKLLQRSQPRGKTLDEVEISTLKEVGNIVASAYLNALGSMLKMPLVPSVPLFSYGMAGAVVDYVLIELGEPSDSAFMIETEFTVADERTSCHFLLLPDHSSLRVILNAVNA